MSLEIIILAAGNGKRMKSDLPKVLHPIGGKPMLAHVIETAIMLQPKKIHVVCGAHTELIQESLSTYWSNRAFAKKDKSDEVIQAALHWVYQEKPLGTGHAVKCVLPFLNEASQVLILFGDVPLMSIKTLQALKEETSSRALGLLLVNISNPFGFGRVLRDNTGKLLEIIEEKDATFEQKGINEIFSGILLSTTQSLKQWLPKLQNDNAQGEYYLTSIIKMAAEEGVTVASVHAPHLFEVQGVNDRVQLIALERIYQELLAKSWLLEGVNISDPARFDVRGELACGQDSNIDVNVVFEGYNVIGKKCSIGPNCIIRNSHLSDNVVVHANSVLDGVKVASNCEIGPFARLRPETVLERDSKVGNFVEMKKSHFGAYSKANHLSYIGDAIIGENVNIGAGTITCNYDGVNKHQTIIEDGAFIGSDTQLVAPVRVGKNATIGAGSTLRKNAPADQLTLNDSKQRSIIGWKRPTKKEKMD